MTSTICSYVLRYQYINNTDYSDNPTSDTKMTGKTKEPLIEVEFHLLMSEQVNFNPNQQNVYLVFGHDRLGGWTSRQYKLSCSYRDKEGVYELAISGKLPADLITNDRYLLYKYLLHGKKKSDVIWEDYARQGKSGQDVNRFIKIPASYKRKDVWYQYDGFFEKKPASYRAIFLNWWNELGLKHAEKCIETFFPEIQYKKEKGVSEFMSHLRMMLTGMKKVYLTDGQCWKSSKEDFEKFVSKQTIETLRKRCEGKDDKEYISILSMCLLLVLSEFESDVFSESDMTKLMQHLRPSVDPGSQTCPELEAITRYMKDKQTYILKAITKIVQWTMKNTKDPSWLYLMPWIHFLSEECKPFDNPPFQINHDDRIPKWWGISTVYENLDKFKSQSWNILPLDMVKNLFPLFKMDYLMPRTFLAATPLKELQGLISLGLFPVEVCLANLIFHLRSSRSYFKRDRKIEKVSTCCETETKMSYKLSSQVITECFSTVDCEDDTVWRCVQMFLRCVGMFESCNKDGNNGDRHRNLMEEIKVVGDRVTQWMSRKETHYLTDKDNENYLKVWNELHAHDTVRSEKIRDAWNKKLSETLSNKFGNRLKAKDHRMSWFVKHYCKNFDSFNPYMQEHLSKLAFEAVKIGHKQEYSSFTDSENKKFGELLSNLFLTEWNKFEKESNNEEHTMVRFLLNWSAFNEYLTIY
ncbi:E3 ubiquitin-protein ligase RNF213-like, partial [Mercenaria mercenaria]|uniref:E3 ubiquitin-protein ligase RNF213-like n=1 Tax=Mercenaria mercenaria TaxID=6596 RepID=UPI00234EBA04